MKFFYLRKNYAPRLYWPTPIAHLIVADAIVLLCVMGEVGWGGGVEEEEGSRKNEYIFISFQIINYVVID